MIAIPSTNKAAPAPTRKPVVSTDVFGPTLTLNFITGEELAIDVTKLSPEIQLQAMIHGIKQKLVDAAAIARNTDNGAAATPQDKYNAVRTVYDRITAPDGTWNAIREGVEKAQGGIFIRAMMELTKKSKADVDADIAKLSKDQIAALKKNVRVMDIMHRLEREALAAKNDSSDDLLAQLTGEAAPHDPDAVEGETHEEAAERRRRRATDPENMPEALV